MYHQSARNHDFHVFHEKSKSTNSFRLRLCEPQAQCITNLPDTTRHHGKSIRDFRKFGHHVYPSTPWASFMLAHCARWLHKSRAWCRITLRDKLYESLRSYARLWARLHFFQWIFWSFSSFPKLAYGIGLTPHTTSAKTNWWNSSYAQITNQKSQITCCAR